MKKSSMRMIGAGILVIMVSLSAYGGGRRSATGSGGISDRSNFNTLGQFPITRQRETVNLMMVASEYDKNDNWMTKYYEDKTNVHVNWIVAPVEQFKERVNIALASQEPLDLIISGGHTMTQFSPTEIMKFAEQGVILPIQDLLESDSIYFKQRLGEYEGWRELITLPNGSIYTLPTLNECYHCMFYGKMWVNKLFLKNVGIDKYPTTIEEFHDMLVAFRDKDANGNGDPNDEIPFMGAVGGYSSKVDTYIMSAFVYDDGENRLYLDRGKVTAAFTKPEFQEGLRVLHQWYREGLIAPESFTQSWDTRYKANSVKYESIVGAHPFEHMFNLGNREDDQPVRWIDYEAIPPLKGPHGLQITRYGYYTKFQYDWPAGFLPATCKNPALIIRWMDWFMSDEGTLALIKGGKGIAWDDADPGATGPDGRPARFKNITMKPTDLYYGNTTWGQSFPNFMSSEFRNMDQAADDMLASDGSGAERYLYVISRDNYAPYVPDVDMLIPPLFYSPENASEMAMLTTNINTYVDECIAKFVVGDMNVETDWNRFQTELKNLGIDRYLNLIQAAYDSSAFGKK